MTDDAEDTMTQDERRFWNKRYRQAYDDLTHIEAKAERARQAAATANLALQLRRDSGAEELEPAEPELDAAEVAELELQKKKEAEKTEQAYQEYAEEAARELLDNAARQYHRAELLFEIWLKVYLAHASACTPSKCRSEATAAIEEARRAILR